MNSLPNNRKHKMEINITKFFNEACPKDYSASVAEIGKHAGAYTYQAAIDDADDYHMLDSVEKREAFKSFVAEFGAWDDEEINAWSMTELEALLIQFISGDMREHDMSPKNNNVDFWDAYERSENAGRIFKGCDGEIYFSLG